VHTPIITASDAEGAGEMFQVRFKPGAAEQKGTCEPSRTPVSLGKDPRVPLTARATALCAVPLPDAMKPHPPLHVTTLLM